MAGAFDRQGLRRITTIDVHTAGEPLRIVTGGFPELAGATILERRRAARRQHDALRQVLMREPRGHADMYGALLLPAATADGDVGVLFLHNEGYSTMCGHGIIGLVKAGLDCGLFVPRDPAAIRIDTPAGRVVARAELRDGRVGRVSFRNVASFVVEQDVRVDVEGLGRVRGDLAFGGAFYLYVDAPALGLELTPANARQLVDVGRRIKRAVAAQCPFAHPTGATDLNFVYGTIFVGPAQSGAHSRNVCIFADGELDRSPTGTGVSGRAAIHHARGELAVGAAITIESVLGTTFDVRIVEETMVGELDAIVPEVSGEAFLTGRHEFVVEPGDPLAAGFLLG